MIANKVTKEARADDSATNDEKVAESSAIVATTQQNKETEEPSAKYEVSNVLVIDKELERNEIIGGEVNPWAEVVPDDIVKKRVCCNQARVFIGSYQ